MEGEKRRKRNLAEVGKVESWEQSRAVNGGAEAHKRPERRSERDGIVDRYRFQIAFSAYYCAAFSLLIASSFARASEKSITCAAWE